MTDSDIEVCKNVEPHELVEVVKSKAVVRYSAMEVPATFNRLQCNTNLNLPPSNWLTSAGSYGLHQSLYQVPGFTSFRLAHMFPDCVGDVDVVSDAENIKKLLKLAYSPKGVISMLVHKVGNSLLLDEFDIQKYLMRRSDNDWNWLRNFILEKLIANGGEPNNFSLKDKSREAIQSKNLLSKFLYYSLEQSLTDTTPDLNHHLQPPQIVSEPVLPEPKVEEKVPDPQTSRSFNRNVLWTFEDIRMLIGTDMPIFGGPNRPCISLRLRDMNKPINVLTGIDYWLDNLMCNVPEVVMCYHLDGLVQKYEIIKTEDLPYLEDSQFSPQAVRNMAHNILAFLKANATKEGHTYWLFKARNDDVVKLYDLTTLCNNQTASTKRGKRDDEAPENPFTVPVAMLLYSVARNIKNTTQHVTPKVAGNIRALLENCIKLLPREKYPQIITSSHYILSDLYIPAGVDPKSPNFDVDVDFETDSVYEDDERSENGSYDEEIADDCQNKELSERGALFEESIAVGQISEMTNYNFDKPENFKTQTNVPIPLVADVEERCRRALEHINAGISCLQFFNECEDNFVKENNERAKVAEKKRIIHEEQNPYMAKPYKPIALPYETLSSQRTTLVGDNSSNDNKNGEQNKKIIKSDFNGQPSGTWTTHLKLLLVEKASLVYATLAEQHYTARRYGTCLKAINMSYRCQAVLIKYMANVVSQKSCLLGRAGDCLFQLAKNFNCIDDSLAQYNENDVINENIVSELEKDLSDETNFIIRPTKNVEELMIASCRCYENALSEVPDSDDYTQQELMRRLGNVSNELGLKYMYWAQDEYYKYQQKLKSESTKSNTAKEKPECKETPLYQQLAMKSYDSLLRGISAFTAVDDMVNLAFLYCNMGRYMRFRAHLNTSHEISLAQQKKFYQEAFEYYEKAKTTLGNRKRSTELWDLFNWELSTATFTLATLLQDSIILEKTAAANLEKETLGFLQKALKLCDTEHVSPRQVLYIYRTGLIHRRIASFHFGQMRRSLPEVTDFATFSRTTLQLCKIHYEKAVIIFESLHEANDLLVTHLERIALQEYLMESAVQIPHKIKHLETALDIFFNAKRVFNYALEQPLVQNTAELTSDKGFKAKVPELPAEKCTDSSTLSVEFLQNSQTFEKRLHFILKALIKMLLNIKDPKKRVDTYKKMYMEALKCELDTKSVTAIQKSSANESETNKPGAQNIGKDENENCQLTEETQQNEKSANSASKTAIENFIKNLLSLLERIEVMSEWTTGRKNSTK